MRSIAETFDGLRERGGKALIPFFTTGYPDLETSLDLIEVGIPFSDPIADGPSIQYSSQEALKHGVTLRGVLASLRGRAQKSGVPLVVMSYVNPILSMGVGEFSAEAGSVPVAGAIIPDMPPEEGSEIEAALGSGGIDVIYLIAPTSGPERMAMVAGRTRGFLYAVSVTGVTGARRELPPELLNFLAGLRRETDKPICVGFGISEPDQARSLGPHADGIIVGSAIVEVIRNNPHDPRAAVGDYLSNMKEALES
jgi:tryptophan synthase alpha chain